MKLILQKIKETPISFALIIFYTLWWITGFVFFKTFDFHSNLAGGIALMSFLSLSLIITIILLIGFLIVKNKAQHKRIAYKVYITYMTLPYFIVLVFYGFQYSKAIISNNYKKDTTKFYFKQDNIQEYIKREIIINSTRIETTTKYSLSNSLYPEASKTQLSEPIIFRRKNMSIIPLQVNYYFGLKDSIVKCVLYDWSGNYPLPKVANLNNNGYRNKYKSIIENLKYQLGSPLSQEINLKKESDEEFNTIWKTNELTLKLYMYLSLTTNRIRCTVYWNK